MDPRTSVISLPELAPSVRTSAAKSLRFPGPTTCTSELAPSVGNSAAKSLKFPGPTTCTSYFAPADPAHGLAFVAEESRENKQQRRYIYLSGCNRTLAKDYEAIAKALTFGPPQRLAKAVLKCKLLSKHVIESVLNLLSNEVSGLCSRKTPSLLRKCGKEDLANFKFQSLCYEWRERSPLFFSFLMTRCISGRSRDQAVKWLPSAVVAGSVLLKQRNQEMNATASVLGVLLKTGSIEANLNRLCKLKLTCSNTSTLSKLDILGAHHNEVLITAKERIFQEQVKLKELTQRVTDQVHACSGNCLEDCLEAQASLEAQDLLKQHQMASHPGFVIAFDNIDLELKVKNMTMSKQNRDIHWVNHKMFINRVHGNSLPCNGPRCDLSEVSNSNFLPSIKDQKRERFNYIVLVSRILTQYFDAFEPLKDVCIQHIPHKYSKEMCEKSTKVPLGIIFKNENLNEDMLTILRQFYTYLPTSGDNEVDPQLFAGDQLTVERAVNVVATVSNGYTPEDRLEGMNFQIGDWHAGVKILSLIFKKFFSAKSDGDTCSLYSDRTLIDRRNVKAEPQSAYHADRDFLVLVIQARVIAAAMTELSFTDKSSQPVKCPLHEDLQRQRKVAKLQYLHKVSSLIVDKVVFDDNSVNGLLEQILRAQETQDALDLQPRTADGRCPFSFKFDGVSRRRHEASHNPPSNDASCQEMTSTSEDPCQSEVSLKDDVYNYNCALLADGLFFLNFLDAVSEGDGFRLITQYKFMMLYCRADGHHSNKYALECLYQAFCVNALLSPRDCERFVWNRSVNNKGGRGKNIPLDLEVEHSNLFNKAAVRNLGANVTEKAVQRISFSEGGTANMTAGVDESLNRLIGSGRHTSSSADRDLGELIKRAVITKGFTEVPNRQYQHLRV
ncbi:uncharacterized protein LOC141878531 [Acropora palmata]|uniref:uncharacterized protein LOC141878531 n=1 Tax=Acropora palmata TaxID=6131 RepID=UPI003DA159E0